MSVQHINFNNFEQEVLHSEKPVLVDFFATWCGPSRMAAPVLDEIAAERDDIMVVKIDVDQEPDQASQFKVYSIPTLMVFKNGEVTNPSLGAQPKAKTLAML